MHGVRFAGFLESDGLFGPLVVRRAREAEALASLYDLDLPEHTVTLWHWYPHLSGDYLPLRLFRNESVSGAGILVNGKGRVAAVTLRGPGRENGTDQEYDTPLEEFSVVQVSTTPLRLALSEVELESVRSYSRGVFQGKKYRFRLIFNSAVYCPVQVSIDGHTMLAIASDGADFEPVQGKVWYLLVMR